MVGRLIQENNPSCGVIWCEKSQFKKANAAEVRKNKIHMKKWMTEYEEDIGDMD